MCKLHVISIFRTSMSLLYFMSAVASIVHRKIRIPVGTCHSEVSIVEGEIIMRTKGNVAYTEHCS
jgi:hypothetical protein